MFCYQIHFNEPVEDQHAVPRSFKISYNNVLIRQAIDKDPVAIDNNYMLSRYEVANNQFEVDYFKLHRYIWSHFLQSDAPWCILIEEGVQLTASPEIITELVDGLPSDWDVFIPFDKIVQPGIRRTKIFSSLLGYFWGAHIYLLSKKGAQKLLALESIKQPLDDEILDLSNQELLESYFLETGFFTYNEKQSPSLAARTKALTARMLKIAAWSEPNKKKVRELISILTDIASRENIQLVLHGGTFLGHVRHAGIIPWDDDVDFGINYNDLERFLQAVKLDGRVQQTRLLHEKANSTTYFYKFWQEGGESIEGHNYTFPFVDLWLYYEKDGGAYYGEGYTFSEEIYYPLRRTTFEESCLFVPNKPLEALDVLFPNWRDYMIVFAWSHRLEKFANKSWTVPVQIDSHGRAIFD